MTTNCEEIFTKPNRTSYYILGAFLTDGCVTKHRKDKEYHAEFSSKDKNWVEKISKLIGGVKITSKKTSINTDHYRIHVRNHDHVNWLINHGCKPNKSLDLRLPQIPDEYFSDFMRSCFEGDGCINFIKQKDKYKRALATYICGSSLSFLESLKTKLTSINIHGKLRNQNLPKEMLVMGKLCKTNPHYRLTFTSSNAIKFLDFIYSKCDDFYMDRKYNKYLEVKKYFNLLPIKPQNKIAWLPNETIVNMVNDSGISGASKILNVSPTGLKARLIKFDLLKQTKYYK